MGDGRLWQKIYGIGSKPAATAAAAATGTNCPDPTQEPARVRRRRRVGGDSPRLGPWPQLTQGRYGTPMRGSWSPSKHDLKALRTGCVKKSLSDPPEGGKADQQLQGEEGDRSIPQATAGHLQEAKGVKLLAEQCGGQHSSNLRSLFNTHLKSILSPDNPLRPCEPKKPFSRRDPQLGVAVDVDVEKPILEVIC